jgi:hypothetical protein
MKNELMEGQRLHASGPSCAGRTEEALELHEETLQLRKAKLGPDHPDTLKSMNNLA